MDAVRIREFFSSQTMNCQTVAFLLAKIHSSLIRLNLQLILLRVLRRVIILSSNKGQWRRI